MSGRIIRQGHVCEGKPNASVGTVWQCDCGRYWVRQASGWVFTTPIAVALLSLNDTLVAGQAEARRKRQLPRDGGGS